MESDLKTLLEARKLGDTVPVLEAYGVQGLETLELLEDTDIDAMAMIEKYRLAPMTGRLLKKELPMLVPALAQKRKEQEEQRKRKEEEEEQKRKEEVRAKIELEQDILKMLPSDASDECRQGITELVKMRNHLNETREQLKNTVEKVTFLEEAEQKRKEKDRFLLDFPAGTTAEVYQNSPNRNLPMVVKEAIFRQDIFCILHNTVREYSVQDYISSQGQMLLMEMLKVNQSLQRLNFETLKVNNLSATLTALAEALKVNQSLKELTVGASYDPRASQQPPIITQYSARVLEEALKVNQSLQELKIAQISPDSGQRIHTLFFSKGMMTLPGLTLAGRELADLMGTNKPP